MLQKLFHCLPLAELKLNPGPVLIQASMLGALSAGWFVVYVKVILKKIFARKCVAREEPDLWN